MKKTKPLFYIALILIGITAGILTRETTRYDFVTSDGREYQWRELNQSWVVVNYFAPWCAPCLKEIPELNYFFANTKPDDVRLFGINYDPADQQQVQALRQKYDIRFPVIVAGPDTQLPMRPPPALPATFIIAPDGQVVSTLMGEISAKQLTATLAKLQE